MEKLNTRQQKIAEKIRELYEPAQFRRIGAAMAFADAIALIIDGLSEGVHPEVAQDRFQDAFNLFSACLADEHKAVIERCVGRQRLQVLANLPPEEISEVYIRILARVQEQHGSLKPGDSEEILEGHVDVSDILDEYM